MKNNNKLLTIIVFIFGLFNPVLAIDETESKKEVLKAIKYAENGSLNAQKTLAALFRDGAKDVKKDSEKSFYWMLKAAEQNDPQSQFNVANKYVKGNGTVKNYELAKKWFLKSGENGIPEGYVEIGTMYANGENKNNSRNYDEALKWFLKAAIKENPQGQFSVGIAYENGLGVKMNYLEAFKWYKKAATKGHTNSELKIAEAYKMGKIGVKKDICESFKWYKKAAKKVDVNVHFHNIKELSDAHNIGCHLN